MSFPLVQCERRRDRDHTLAQWQVQVDTIDRFKLPGDLRSRITAIALQDPPFYPVQKAPSRLGGALG